jgi:hypothetical protein
MMSRVAVRPYLVAKDDEGSFRITIRRTRFNSQGYPLVVATLLDDRFPTAAAAKVHIRTEYNAVTTDIATS